MNSILCQVAQGLAYIHSKSFMHRDVKPGSILVFDRKLGRDLTIKLANFELAVLNETPDVENFHEKCGTTEYMAPEVYLCDRYSVKRDIACDVFSYGMTSWEVINGGR